MPRSGDTCEQCKAGRYKTYKTTTKGRSRIRYLKCLNCGHNEQELCRVDDIGRTILDLFTMRGIDSEAIDSNSP